MNLQMDTSGNVLSSPPYHCWPDSCIVPCCGGCLMLLLLSCGLFQTLSFYIICENSFPASTSPRGQPRHQDNSLKKSNEHLHIFIISQYLNLTPTFVLRLCTESAHGPTGSTGRSRTMSTSVQKTPCEPPLDLSEPRHAAQKPHPVLMFTPCPHRPNLKFSIPPPSPLAFSPGVNFKDHQGRTAARQRQQRHLPVGDDDDDDDDDNDGDDVDICHRHYRGSPVKRVSTCTLSLLPRVFLKN